MIPYHSHSNTPPRIISCKNFYLVPKRASTTSPTPPATTAGTHHLSTIQRKYDCTRNPCRDDIQALGSDATLAVLPRANLFLSWEFVGASVSRHTFGRLFDSPR